MNQLENAPLVYVSFSAEINTQTTETLISTMAQLANKKVQEVCLLLSTPGGGVREGLNLYNVMRGMPFELVTHNVSSVNSIGNMVFLAGSKRYATDNATFVFHGVGFTAQSNQRLEEKRLRELLGSLDNDQKQIGAIIQQNTNIGEEEITGLFLEAQTKRVDFAKEKGIIHDVQDVKIPKNCPVIALVFKR